MSRSKSPRIIAEVMKTYHVDPKEIPEENTFNPRQRWSLLHNSLRYFKVRGKGWYSCKCESREHSQSGDQHNWASPNSWCIIDLKEQKIRYSWYEECQHCKTKTLPRFPLEEIYQMAVFVVKQYLARTGDEVLDDYEDKLEEEDERLERGPHIQDLCGMCRDLHRPCWEKVKRRSRQEEWNKSTRPVINYY